MWKGDEILNSSKLGSWNGIYIIKLRAPKSFEITLG
jgi:hypothetical protein